MGIRSSAAIIENNQILMVRQLYKGEEIWTFPGGSIEQGETPEQAAVRKVYEETGPENPSAYKSPKHIVSPAKKKKAARKPVKRFGAALLLELIIRMQASLCK